MPYIETEKVFFFKPDLSKLQTKETSRLLIYLPLAMPAYLLILTKPARLNIMNTTYMKNSSILIYMKKTDCLFWKLSKNYHCI